MEARARVCPCLVSVFRVVTGRCDFPRIRGLRNIIPSEVVGGSEAKLSKLIIRTAIHVKAGPSFQATLRASPNMNCRNSDSRCCPFFHLVKNSFPLLVLKGIYHYWKYVYLFFQGHKANGCQLGMNLSQLRLPVVSFSLLEGGCPAKIN